MAFRLILCLAIATALMPRAEAQTYRVIYGFSDYGFYPTGGVSIDRAGNLYGTVQYGGSGTACYLGCGAVFKLAPHGSSWLFTPLYNFMGGTDGGNPTARVVIGPGGSLFGTTTQGGGFGCLDTGCGTVFNLRPSQHISNRVIAPWSETVLYRFQGGNDGAMPESADLAFDQAGNIYGTTLVGGGSQCSEDCGIVYQLTNSNGNWTENILHIFGQSGDGDQPYVGVILDHAGNLYGATANGGAHHGGTVYELERSGAGWTEQLLHSFQPTTDGEIAYGGLLMDATGDLYGTTCCSGPQGQGTAYELTANNWTFDLLYSLGAAGTGQEPEGGLIMDAAGNLYGTASSGGAYNFGAVFKLTLVNGTWTYTSLHDFCPQGYPCSDGYTPTGALAMDSAGNIYGTTANGGTGGGVVYEITP